MRYGVCGDAGLGSALADAGFDYMEVNVQGSLKPEADDKEFIEELKKLKACALPCEAANCLLPGDLKVTGPAVDWPRLSRYLQVAFRRAREAGLQTIVFGSGGARRIPDGFDRGAAWKQLVDFARAAGAAAAEQGIVVVAEPLNKKESNVLVTVGEAGRLVDDAAHSNFALLVDAYHWNLDHDSVAELVAYGSRLRHAHIATTATRKAPGLEPCDFGPFFRALREGGYDGRISIEGGWTDLRKDAPRALSVLKEAERAAAEAQG